MVLKAIVAYDIDQTLDVFLGETVRLAGKRLHFDHESLSRVEEVSHDEITDVLSQTVQVIAILIIDQAE